MDEFRAESAMDESHHEPEADAHPTEADVPDADDAADCILESTTIKRIRAENPDIDFAANHTDDVAGHVSHAPIGELFEKHKAAFTKPLQAVTRFNSIDHNLPVGQYGQMRLIRTPDALTGGPDIRFVNWTVAGQRGRLVSLDHRDKPIWTTNAQRKELGLVDAKVLIRNTGTRCLQTKQEFRPTID